MLFMHVLLWKLEIITKFRYDSSKSVKNELAEIMEKLCQIGIVYAFGSHGDTRTSSTVHLLLQLFFLSISSFMNRFVSLFFQIDIIASMPTYI